LYCFIADSDSAAAVCHDWHRRGKEETMRTFVIAATLYAGYLLAHGSPALAQDQWGMLSPMQRQAYHACLYAAWVQDYCRENSRAVNACIVANGAGGFPVDRPLFTDDYCWHAAQAVGVEVRTK
jgi:hypothetical protein